MDEMLMKLCFSGPLIMKSLASRWKTRCICRAAKICRGQITIHNEISYNNTYFPLHAIGRLVT